jgi:hypothetical protein
MRLKAVRKYTCSAVRSQSNRAEQDASNDLGNHYRTAEPDHEPGFALALHMAVAKKDMAVSTGLRLNIDVQHFRALTSNRSG